MWAKNGVEERRGAALLYPPPGSREVMLNFGKPKSTGDQIVAEKDDLLVGWIDGSIQKGLLTGSKAG